MGRRQNGGITGARIVIVGGGITGVFAAWFAARRGAEVTVLERDAVAAHASANSAGGLNPMHGAGIPGPLHEFALASLRLHVAHWDEIGETSTTRLRPRMVTRLHVALSEDEAQALRARQELYASTENFAARWLDARALAALEPRLTREALGALSTEGNAHVDPGPYTRAVAEAARSRGARFITAEATGIRHAGARLTHVESTSGNVACDAALIAPGVWSEGPAAWLGIHLPVEPVKGELLLAEIAGELPPADISWTEVGIYAAGPGRVLLGGVEDRAGYDESPTASARARILAGVARLMPGLAGVRIAEHRVGLRPVTPDGFPIVGIPSGWANVCVAAGAGRKGMLYGAGLGRAATDLLLDGETPLPIRACTPEREALV